MAFTKKPRVFILGVSGLLGNALAWHFRDKFDVTGAYFHNPVRIPDVQCYPISNVAQATNILETMVRVLNPDFCIMACGINDRKMCDEQAKLAEGVNIYLPLSLAIVASKIKAKNINLSCSDIFDGYTGNYNEKNVTAFSLEEYSKQKISAETFIRSQTMENTTLRLGRVVGLGNPFRYNYFDQIRSKLAANKNVTASSNKIRSFLSLSSACDAIEKVITNPIPVQQRLFHVGGPAISEQELITLICERLGYDPKLIKAPLPKDDFKSNLTVDSTQFMANYSWKQETKEELLKAIFQNLRPGLPPKKLPTISQTL